MAQDQSFEVIIIGGSYAGLSAAMALGRSLRKTLVIDGGKPCNQQTPYSHNFLTQDGSTPKQINTLARQQVAQYESIQFVDDVAVKAEKIHDGFGITSLSGKTFTGKKLVLASGIKDKMPNISGFSECWGISVIHCPYCHGYEYRGHNTGIFANGERAFHLAALVNNLTSELTVLTNGKADFTSEQSDDLKRHNIAVIGTEIAAIVHRDGYLEKVNLMDGNSISLTALYAAIPFFQHSDIAASLGCELTTPGHIKVDLFQKTTIPDVFACGDNSSMIRSVANAIATGNIVGAMINRELTMEQF